MEPHTALHDMIDDLAATLRMDHAHGASYLAQQAAAGIAAILERGDALGLDAVAAQAIGLEACRAVAQARPSMAPLITVASRIAVRGGSDATARVQLMRDAARDILARWQSAPGEIAAQFTARLGTQERIVTLSRSATVTAALKGAAGHIAAITALESRPGGEGVAAAQDLAGSAGWQVRLMPDAAMEFALADATAIVVGADAILASGFFANKTGTGPLTRLARARDIPVYVVAESLKIAPAAWVWQAEEFPTALITPAPLPGITISVPAFERVPSDSVTLLGEAGVMTPALIAQHAAAGDLGYQNIVGEQPKK